MTREEFKERWRGARIALRDDLPVKWSRLMGEVYEYQTRKANPPVTAIYRYYNAKAQLWLTVRDLLHMNELGIKNDLAKEWERSKLIYYQFKGISYNAIPVRELDDPWRKDGKLTGDHARRGEHVEFTNPKGDK